MLLVYQYQFQSVRYTRIHNADFQNKVIGLVLQIRTQDHIRDFPKQKFNIMYSSYVPDSYQYPSLYMNRCNMYHIIIMKNMYLF